MIACERHLMNRLIAALICLASPAAAQDLSLRLNALTPQQSACRVVFVLQSGIGIDGLEAEIILFDRTGRVVDFTALDFRDLPQDRPRVRSFDLPGLDCNDLGALLVNGIARCEGPGIDACQRALVTGSDVAGVELRG
jgi:hypothetical protein